MGFTTITREIGIDAGHRVPDHHSKCRNPHGHRYRIEVTCAGGIKQTGSEQGMVMDFGFLKEVLVQFIDANCDHTFIVCLKDPLLEALIQSPSHFQEIANGVRAFGSHRHLGKFGMLYVVPFVPTVEMLCQHWFHLIAGRIHARSGGTARLLKVKAWETPNSFAEYTCD